MSSRERCSIPPTPKPPEPPKNSWLTLLTPLIISMSLFAVTGSGYTLILAAASPLAFWISRVAHQRSEAKRYRLESSEYQEQVDEIVRRAANWHERERSEWLSSNPESLVLGYGAKPSNIRIEQNSTLVDTSLRDRIAINPLMPLALSNLRTTSQLPELAFEGVLASRLKLAWKMHPEVNNLGSGGGTSQEKILLRRRAGEFFCEPFGQIRPHIPAQAALIRELRSHSTQQKSSGEQLNQADLTRRNSTSRSDLFCELGVEIDSGSSVVLNLVTDGPHLVIGGTTGSGKSVLLKTLIFELAMRYSPEALGFLLIDFKGGTALHSLANLPHTLELLTDLDPASTHRAVLGLTAEIRRRENLLRSNEVADIAELPADEKLARFVIVVDEFATLINELPELHSVFVDVAARGRALGIHLVLATQRPSGALRDSLATNCSLRLSLRVTTAAESQALLGSPIAAQFRSTDIGYCVHANFGAVSQPWRVRLTPESAIAELVKENSNLPATNTPWSVALPTSVDFGERRFFADGGLFLGLMDVPEEQCQRDLLLPLSGEHAASLFVLGARGSGKTNLCELMAQQMSNKLDKKTRVDFASADPAAQFDQVSRIQSRIQLGISAPDAPVNDPSEAVLWLLDDLDLLLNSVSLEQQHSILQVLNQAVRLLPASDAIVCTASKLTSGVTQLASLSGLRLHFRASSKEEHLAWGLPAAQFGRKSTPGRAIFDGNFVQIARCEDRATRRSASVENWNDVVARQRKRFDKSPIIVLTSRPSYWREHQVSQTPEDALLVIEPEDVFVHPEKPMTLLRSSDWIFDALLPGEAQQITRGRHPQPVISSPHHVLAWRHDRGFWRVTLRGLG